ncbi:unnamed protein product [Brachionus calyciflorus]|uniref:RRM domain-containing protein n=1 Tax=Brachionus calyciflorus TaxID=104777 RepID=A0A814AS10_9BILA|nr:unnamed protein product [Brachionus calyciflorus]
MQTNSTNPTVSFTVGQNLNYAQKTLGLLQTQQPSTNNLLNSNFLQLPQPIQAQTQQQEQTKDTTFTKIFVGGLPYHTTDESLKAFFQRFGNIEEAVVILDRSTGKSRGYGFVTMETKEAAEAAVLDPNPVIDGRKANVNLAYLGVKSKIVQPTNYFPLALSRFPIPATTATYGVHPLYYQQLASSSIQPAFQLATTPNLLLSAQPTQAAGTPNFSPLTNSVNTNLFDLYTNSQLTTAPATNQFLQFNTTQLTNTNPSALNSVLTTTNANTQSAPGYFSLSAQNLASFQSQ